VIPKQVEAKIQTCPGVARVAVLQIKDQLGKPQLTAVVSKQVGMDISATDVQKFCEANLKEFERPKNVAFMDELPLDSHGQINKYKLRFEFNS
jgi:acyl-CoA synthetase (AMP-forming)/AMP-acid ligase II